MIKSFISKYLIKGMLFLILILFATNGYQYLRLTKLENTNQNLENKNTLLISANQGNVKTIEDLQFDILSNERLLLEQTIKISELNKRTCDTIGKIGNIQTSAKEKNENVNENVKECDIDDNIPAELSSLFESAGY